MEYCFHAKILAYSREDATAPTVLLEIVPTKPELVDITSAILEGGPVLVEDKSFIWSEEACLVGLSIWEGHITANGDTVEFNGTWDVPSIKELKELGGLL